MGENEMKELVELRKMREKVRGYGLRYREKRKLEIEKLEKFFEKWNGKKVGNVVIE